MGRSGLNLRENLVPKRDLKLSEPRRAESSFNAGVMPR